MLHQDLLGMCKRLQKAVLLTGSPFSSAGRRRILKFWLQVYRKYEVPGLVVDHDLFARMNMTGKEREVLMEVMPYVLMFYRTPFSDLLLRTVVCRNEWAALRDREHLTAETLDDLKAAGAPGVCHGLSFS